MYVVLGSILLLSGAACAWLSNGRTKGLHQAGSGPEKQKGPAAGVYRYIHMHWEILHI